MMIKDMKKQIDPSQYANQEGLYINHYLLKTIDKILKIVDSNCKKECDWKQCLKGSCKQKLFGGVWKIGGKKWAENSEI